MDSYSLRIHLIAGSQGLPCHAHSDEFQWRRRASTSRFLFFSTSLGLHDCSITATLGSACSP